MRNYVMHIISKIQCFLLVYVYCRCDVVQSTQEKQPAACLQELHSLEVGCVEKEEE